MPSLEEAAVHYAELGFYVFPLNPRLKDPATYHGFKDASNVPDTVRAWWIQNPDYNIGIACGHGLAVIDIDNHPEEGRDGYGELRKWEKEHGELAPTWTVLTGTGGLHYWYKSDTDFKPLADVLPGIDVRTAGSYVVAPPSVHPNGTPYSWEASGDPDDIEMAEASGSALELLKLTLAKKKKDNSAGNIPYKDRKEHRKGERVKALMMLQGHLKNLNVSPEAIKAAVREENELKCIPPLTEEELQKTIFPFADRDIPPEYDYSESVAPATALDDGITEDELEMPTLDLIPKRKAEWFESGYIPAKAITILCGTGGVGKTTIWCAIAAAVSRGEQTLLTVHDSVVTEQLRENRRVMFFSAEDSVSVVLVEKMEKSRAVLKNIMCFDVTDKRFRDIKMSSPYLEKLIAKYKPALCVFDPVQAFIDKRIKMSDRNAMRQEVEPLIRLGEDYGTTFLIVMHTNKQSGVWGRRRMADSADLWDVARSVLMVGETSEEGIGYISHEKSSYGRTSPTVLFKTEGGVATYHGTTTKKDRDYVMEEGKKASGDKTEELTEACNFILSALTEQPDGVLVKDLEEEMEAYGFSGYMIRNAKKELKHSNLICYKRKGMTGGWRVYTMQNLQERDKPA